MEQPLYVRLARTLAAYRNCEASGNHEWRVRHEMELSRMQRDELPHGSGIDGTAIPLDLDASTPERLVFVVPFHPMNDHGSYVAWTTFKITVRPSLQFGIDLRITGRDYNGAKEYVAEAFSQALDGMREEYTKPQ